MPLGVQCKTQAGLYTYPCEPVASSTQSTIAEHFLDTTNSAVWGALADMTWRTISTCPYGRSGGSQTYSITPKARLLLSSLNPTHADPNPWISQPPIFYNARPNPRTRKNVATCARATSSPRVPSIRSSTGSHPYSLSLGGIAYAIAAHTCSTLATSEAAPNPLEEPLSSPGCTHVGKFRRRERAAKGSSKATT